MVHCSYLGVSVWYIFFKKYCIPILKIFFTFTNSADPDEMQFYAAFHLGLHCLQKYSGYHIPPPPGQKESNDLSFRLDESNNKFQECQNDLVQQRRKNALLEKQIGKANLTSARQGIQM